MFSEKSLKKVSDMIKEKIAFYLSMDRESIKICITAGNRKIGKF